MVEKQKRERIGHRKQDIKLEATARVFEKKVNGINVGKNMQGHIYLPEFLIGKRVFLVILEQDQKENLRKAVSMKFKTNKRLLGGSNGL